MTYEMDIAGLKRDLPLCKVSDDLYIGAFVMFGDVEMTIHAAKELLKRLSDSADGTIPACEFAAEGRVIKLALTCRNTPMASRKQPRMFHPNCSG